MLISAGKTSLFFRLGKRICVCMRNSRLDPALRARIRPFVIGWYSCWCDKPNAG